MMTRAEKLFCIRAQVQKAASEIEHGDTYASCMALGDALSALLNYLEEEMPEKPPIHPEGERVKELPVVVGLDEGDHPRAAELPQPTKIKRR
jgi:hypothetical protein